MKSRLPAVILLFFVALFQQCLKDPLKKIIISRRQAFVPEGYQMNFEAHLLLRESAPLGALTSPSELELIAGVSGKTALKLYKKLLQINKSLSMRQPQDTAMSTAYVQSELEKLDRIGPKKAKLLMQLLTID
jgi:hypothetical protein